MSLALIVAVGGLAAIGTYLITARSLSRIVLGFSLLGHAAVLALLAAGWLWPVRAGHVHEQSDESHESKESQESKVLTITVKGMSCTHCVN
ncbi:MAG: NADH-quinone oxidoreductase subunit K, partial [Acidimicrobiales bacterium]